MRRTIITNLQWFLVIVVLAVGMPAYAIVDRKFGGWWQVLVLWGVLILLAVVLRFRWETSTQAYERRKDARRRRWLRKYMSDEQRKAAADRGFWLREP